MAFDNKELLFGAQDIADGQGPVRSKRAQRFRQAAFQLAACLGQRIEQAGCFNPNPELDFGSTDKVWR
jgi:hypothetical protein